MDEEQKTTLGAGAPAQTGALGAKAEEAGATDHVHQPAAPAADGSIQCKACDAVLRKPLGLGAGDGDPPEPEKAAEAEAAERSKQQDARAAAASVAGTPDEKKPEAAPLPPAIPAGAGQRTRHYPDSYRG